MIPNLKRNGTAIEFCGWLPIENSEVVTHNFEPLQTMIGIVGQTYFLTIIFCNSGPATHDLLVSIVVLLHASEMDDVKNVHMLKPFSAVTWNRTSNS